MKYLCSYHNCKQEAVGGVGIEVYPTKALMKFYKTNQPITRIIVDLKICRDHLPAKEEVIRLDYLANYTDMIERHSGTTVDRDAYKMVIVPFDAPDYHALLSKSDGEMPT